MPIAFELNGVAREVDVQQDEPLLYPLRRLGDVSVRYGCGAEQCGACRVLVDGQLAFACTMPAQDAQGRSVETAAGLDSPVRRALLDFNAGQCGYCLPGIVVAAEALFRPQQFAPANSRRARKGAQAPTDADIRAALAPHLCRCGAHPRILRALAACRTSRYGGEVRQAASRSCERTRARRPVVRASELPTRPQGPACESCRRGPAVSLPPGLRAFPRLSNWVRIEAPDRVVAHTGKVEIGQGILTALRLIVAEELDVDPERVVIETAHTGRTPNEGITAGSMSLETSGAALRQAAAWLRRLLLERAAAELGVGPERITVENGILTAPGINRPLDYWQLEAVPADFELSESTAEKRPADYRLVGVGHAPRIDLAAKVRGEPAFVHDLPSDLHARVVRPPSMHHRLDAIAARIELPGHLVVNGSFVAVAHPDEFTASRLAERVRSRARWHAADVPAMAGTLADHMRKSETAALPLDDGKPTERPARDLATTHHATYSRPFLMHGSLGPSAAWALWQGGRMLVRSSSQGIEFLKAMLAKVLGLELEQVEVAHSEGAGCYGHNGADDAALDAALVARALPDQAILLQWTRADEHRFEPLGPAMQVELGASIESGAVSHWRHDVRGFTHSGRPAPQRRGVDMLAAWLMDEPFEPTPPQPGRGAESGLHRNALPLYEFPNQEVVKRFCTASPLRTSSLRSLGAHCNVFAIESFMDELAQAAKVAPDEFRRRHLAHDPRALAVLNAALQLAGGLDGPRGVAIARYKNRQCCAAVVVEVAVSDAAEVLVRRAWIAADAGRIVDRDGLTNQLEGGFVQALSWTLFEEVSFDTHGVTDTDWNDYPILRFSDVPRIETTLLDHPEQQPVGAGEALQGPTSAAVANAIFAATGIRPRDLPFNPANLRRAAAS